MYGVIHLASKYQLHPQFGLVYGILRNFQQYFIVAGRVSGEKHHSVASQ
jgi:hypothetical protein